ncbi:addiction module toxin RelE [archaeon]|jgi:YafQ family addiction module toxin component|nr:addiction module toxin RelE [archaeon]
MFDYDFSDELKFKIRKLIRKDKKKADIIYKKVNQIISCDSNSINHYKNLRGNMKEFKRVHIDKSFVLTFNVDLPNNFILFEDFDHHDRVY